MIPEELYFASLDRGIRLFVEEGKLKFHGPKGALSDQIQSELKLHREQIIDFLSTARDIENYYPLSLNQKSLWYEYIAAPKSHSYNILFPLVIDNQLCKEKVVLSLERLQKKYPLLRSQIRVKGTDAVPFRYECYPNDDLVIDMEDTEKKAIKAFCEEPFDLENQKPYRVGHYKSQERTTLVFVFHHIIGDAMSFRYFFDDFFFSLDGDLVGTDRQYDFFTERQQELYFDKDLRETLRKRLSDHIGQIPSEIKLPRDYPRNKPRAGRSTSLTLTVEEYSQLGSLCKVMNIKKGVLLLCVYEVFLRSITGEDSPVYAMTTPGRTHSNDKSSIGYYVNPVICSATGDHGHSFSEFINTVRSKSIDTQSFQDYPLTMVLEDLDYKRIPRVNPGFQILFNYIDQTILHDYTSFFMPQEKTKNINGSYSVRNIYLPQQEGQFDMTFEAFDDGQDLTVFLKYDGNLFSDVTVDSMIILIKEILVSFLGGTLLPIDQLRLKWNEKRNLRRVISLAGNYTITPLIFHLREWARIAKVDWRFRESLYNQVFQLLLDPEGDFVKGESKINVLFLSLLEWKNIPDISKELTESVYKYAALTDKPLFIFFTESAGKSYSELESSICNNLNGLSRVFSFTSMEIGRHFPIAGPSLDNITYDSGHIPYTEEYFAALSTLTFRRLYSYGRKALKVLIVDGDNTLWNGILGEDGPCGIRLEDPHLRFQRKILEWKEKGILVCLVTKNNESDLKKLWSARNDLPLGEEDFTIIKSNWNLKSQNIKEIAQTLNLGLDSFLFVDDNPMEIFEVSESLPSVKVISAFKEGKHIGDFIDHLWAFDILKVTVEDRQRNDFYKREVQREILGEKSDSYREFLSSLQVKVEISPLEEKDTNRASQLTYRTNQFNFLTQRVQENEFVRKQESGTSYFKVKVSDRFGEYGFVGLMGINRIGNQASLENFLLSCRALGKGVEYLMMNYLGNYLEENGLPSIEIRLKHSGRNQPACEFFHRAFNGMTEKENELTVTCDASDLGKIKADGTMGLNKSKTAAVSEKTVRNDQTYENSFLEKILYDSGPGYYKSFSKDSSGYHEPIMSPDRLNEILHMLWSSKLGHSEFTAESNFFEVGGKSVMIPGMLKEIRKIDEKVSLVDFFVYPSIQSFCRYILGNSVTEKADRPSPTSKPEKARRAMRNFKQRRRR